MERFFPKKSVKRKKQWVIPSSSSEDDDLKHDNKNTNNGSLLPTVKEDNESGMRPINKGRPKSIKVPFLDMKVQPQWRRIYRNWAQELYYSHFKASPKQINTSFQLPDDRHPNAARFVNTRTSDMEISPSSTFLAVTSNYIKGGFVSIVNLNDMDKDESLLYSHYNTQLLKPTQYYFKEPIFSCHWFSSSELLVVRRACRELSIFDAESIQTNTIATLPYFIDYVIPMDNNTFIVSLGDGQIKWIDCRDSRRFLSFWTTDNTKHRTIRCVMVDETKPNELVVSYQSPCSMDVLDVRNTRFSTITGKKSPILLKSSTLSFPDNSFPISIQPFFSEEDVVASLSDGAVAVVNRYSGDLRIYSNELCGEELYQWDSIISRPFRPYILNESMWIPSIVRRTQSVPIFDFQSLSFQNGATPHLLRGPSVEDVYGCCYWKERNVFIVSSQGNTLEHRLLICNI